MFGVRFIYPAVLSIVLTLGVLGFFRWIETRLPSHFYAHHLVRFDRSDAITEQELRDFVRDHGFTVANMSYRLTDDGGFFEYFMVIRTNNLSNMSNLADALRQMENVRVFRISPTGN